MTDLAQMERKLHGYQVVLWYVPGSPCAALGGVVLPARESQAPPKKPTPPARTFHGLAHTFLVHGLSI
jgi:hypothetical protein